MAQALDHEPSRSESSARPDPPLVALCAWGLLPKRVYNALARRNFASGVILSDHLPPMDQIRLSDLQAFGSANLLRLPNLGRRSLRTLALVMSRYGWDLAVIPVLSPRPEAAVRDSLAAAWRQLDADKALLSSFLAQEDWKAVAARQGLSSRAAYPHLLRLAARPPLPDPPPVH